MDNKTSVEYLMELLDISGKELAKYLCVDRSLVSKWKNNARPFTTNSAYFYKVAEYFLLVNTRLNSRTLENFFAKIYPEVKITNNDDIMSCIKRFLTEDMRLLSNSIDYNTSEGSNVYSANFRVYRGDSGRRRAVLEFFNEVLSCQEPQKILLSSKEDMSWVFDNRNFTKLWQKNLLDILLKNHKIHIIHETNRDIETLVSSIIAWVPLYFTGNLTSYFNPNYTDDIIKTSLFIIENKNTIFGMEAKNNKRDRYTASFKDSQTQNQMEYVFYSYVKNCNLLNEIYKTDTEGTKNLMEKIISIGNKKEEAYIYTALPTFVTMDIDTLSMVLDENSVGTELKEECFNIYIKINEFFKKDLGSFFFRQFYDLDSLKQAADSEDIKYFDLSNLCGKEIMVSNKHFKNHIKSLIEMTKLYKLDEVAIVTFNQFPIPPKTGIWVKRHGFAYAYPQYEAPCHTIINEIMLINAFFAMFNKIWNSIPIISKDKNIVIEELEKLIS